MVPAKLVQAAVTMLADAIPELLDFIYQLLTRHPIEIFIHDVPPNRSPAVADIYTQNYLIGQRSKPGDA
jgi:hypothetical protein